MWFASLVSVSLSILLVFLLFRLWSTDLDIPFNNGIDALYAQVFINNLFASGWSNENARLGAPYGCDLKDFPLSEMAHLYLLQLLGLCKNHVGWAMNLFFLLSFPMAALTASITFCSLGIRWVPSIVCAVLFAFLPYHFARGEAHLFLSAYYFVPLTILVATWLHQGLLSCQRDQPWRVRLVLAVVICLLSSSGGIYYAFFGAFFILIGTVGVGDMRRSPSQRFANVVLSLPRRGKSLCCPTKSK
jgi:phosphoglycerol transferase